MEQLTMERIARIAHMEACLDHAWAALDRLSAGLEAYQLVRHSLKELTAYYEGPLWKQDFEADEAGQLPPSLKRGVLSEDGVYDLLTYHARLLHTMKEVLDHADH